MSHAFNPAAPLTRTMHGIHSGLGPLLNGPDSC